jgi:hypothetical protein
VSVPLFSPVPVPKEAEAECGGMLTGSDGVGEDMMIPQNQGSIDYCFLFGLGHRLRLLDVLSLIPQPKMDKNQIFSGLLPLFRN